MGPAILFDKSFLQSISVDESVWFDRFFIAVVCPIFYLETLGDLAKEVSKSNRSPEAIVQDIARKFPELSGSPCSFHLSLAVGDLLGQHLPMDGRIPRSGARRVKSGAVFDMSPEETAFQRWQEGHFSDVEHIAAGVWRDAVSKLDLAEIAKQLRELGVDAKACRTLEDASAMARRIVCSNDRILSRVALAIVFFKIPEQLHHRIVNAWQASGRSPLHVFAPYAAYVLTIEVFFQIALGAGLIGTERPSNRTDIAYLHYLPFCHLFVSWDKLHQKCAPLFLRQDQQFLWAPDLKMSLKTINSHFLEMPEKERERGVISIATQPPPGNLVAEIWKKRLGKLDREEAKSSLPRDTSNDADLVRKITEFQNQPTLHPSDPDFSNEEEMLSITRKVSRKRGSWWQVPKDLPDRAEIK